MYGNSSSTGNTSPPSKISLNSKSNCSEDCAIVEKAHSYRNLPKVQGISTYSLVEEEERAHGSSNGTKRTHMEFSSPRNENVKSPKCDEEANTGVSGNGFVTARAKLVTTSNSRDIFLFLFFLKATTVDNDMNQIVFICSFFYSFRPSYLHSACN